MIGILSKYFPRITGIIVFVVTIALEVKILSKGFTWGQIGTALLIGVPLFVASWGLWRNPKTEDVHISLE